MCVDVELALGLTRTQAPRVSGVAPREIGDDLSEALHQHDICEALVDFGVENGVSVARDAHITRENSTGLEFRDILEMLCGKVEKTKAATPQANINAVKEGRPSNRHPAPKSN